MLPFSVYVAFYPSKWPFIVIVVFNLYMSSFISIWRLLSAYFFFIHYCRLLSKYVVFYPFMSYLICSCRLLPVYVVFHSLSIISVFSCTRTRATDCSVWSSTSMRRWRASWTIYSVLWRTSSRTIIIKQQQTYWRLQNYSSRGQYIAQKDQFQGSIYSSKSQYIVVVRVYINTMTTTILINDIYLSSPIYPYSIV